MLDTIEAVRGRLRTPDCAARSAPGARHYGKDYKRAALAGELPLTISPPNAHRLLARFIVPPLRQPWVRAARAATPPGTPCTAPPGKVAALPR
jgi:hypothetical protein